ncbi:hypothetical protein [Paractinoplanes rishiriensis]|uniref:Uncharacterized protein n=1 Tax=Paractinoplanes rishiriensis TaxID=1050105 RepID=A0A919KBJ4_9ACTN|nr:hypothetical protein [Actinoplanes rishiriensis]GIF02373.1 hypothetical protein Ari01nite_98370 [Actinoplanes rishiriensis]
MRWLSLYARSRRAPMALGVTAGCAAVMWSLWSVSSDDRDAAVQTVVLTVLLLVAALTVTLGGPDDELEATAALRWLPRRAGHVLVAYLMMVLILALTRATGARFGPLWLVLRDAGGLLGLTALAAATIGTARSWFVPLGWTVAAVLFPQSGPVAGRILTWQMQPPESAAAAVTAALLGVGGLIVYAVTGPARR